MSVAHFDESLLQLVSAKHLLVERPPLITDKEFRLQFVPLIVRDVGFISIAVP